ncbi:MAG TPA: hypothetical protein VGH16_02250, partial [Candidatus Binatia bacterium]
MSKGYRDLVKQHYRLIRALPAFFRVRVTIEQAEAAVRLALETREKRFLDLAQRHIFERSRSPYLKLFDMAGCELGDLRDAVMRDGVEETLEKLAKEGVYFTADEFKGKTDVVRGSRSFRVSPGDFEPPTPSAGVTTRSSGTSNAPIASVGSLERWGERTSSHSLFYSAHDLFSRAHGIFEAILPSGGGIRAVVQHARLGIRTERWFARRMPTNNSASRSYNTLMTHLFVAMADIYGPGAARPEFTALEDVDRIVAWIAKVKREGRDCCVKTSAGNATRIAQAAARKGIAIDGTKFHLGGEPFTEAKRDAIAQVGAEAVTDYAFEGGGSVAMACANPLYIDDMHVQQHRLAVITLPLSIDGGSSTMPRLFCTTLHDGYAKMLLNVANGDYATFEKRACGCAFERVGLKLHLHHIRSYEKFTSEGMNYFYGDLHDFFESHLPREFGGAPGDYQLV